LRSLEAFPVEHDGQRRLALRDPAGLTEHVAVLPLPLLDLVSLFDGERSVDEIRGVLAARHGVAPTAEQVARVIEELDDAGFLDSEGFRARREAVELAYRRSAARPAAHAGGAYAADPAGLAAQIDSFFTHPDGPGPPPAGRPDAGTPPLRGLLAPHIDFHRGGPVYAWAYRALLEASEADLFVVLGTCHAGMADPFAVTLKPFETPRGRVTVDQDLYEARARRAGQDLLASEPAHRHEHSVEFQAVMLQHLVGPRRPFTILPVLASYVHEAVWRRTDPEADPRVPRFIDALLSAMATSGRRVCVVAGVDLAHVGPRFGDPERNTSASLQAVEAADRRMLEAVIEGDPVGFFGSVAADDDRRRICGLSPIYTALRTLPGARGRLLRYAQWPDPEGAVTFCAAGLA
jgi:AmmeMemoRadiSam system protein B